MRILISTGGSCCVTEAFRRELYKWKPDLVIAADSGLRHLASLGLKPDILLGDMDSIAPELLEQARHSGVEPQICPSHKDETDTELALSIALEKGGSQPELRLIGAFGSRMDHSLANLHLLNRVRSQAEFWDGLSRIQILQGPAAVTVERPSWFAPEKPAYVSLLPYGGPVGDITLSGFEYPLLHYEMDENAVIGISNQLTGVRGTVEFASGRLLCASVQE